MMVMVRCALLAALLAVVNGSPVGGRHDVSFGKRQYNTNGTAIVDLGYSVYQGVPNTTTGITSWLGMRYAASTEGKNRWQAPQPPEVDRDIIKQANAFPQRCPQGGLSPVQPTLNYTGTEDCLFLSVQAPIGAANGSLPVFVTIHGGGYGQGQGNQDLTALINANGNSFVGVIIQYRLAAFGYLSSDEVKKYGTPNAGILDQAFSFKWIQDNIAQFGGDPRRVTISGESAGGGSVMLQAMAYGGTLGTSLFTNAIVASPYLPMQYNYNDEPPTRRYNDFAAAAGCSPSNNTSYLNSTIFDCLVSKDTEILQAASAAVSGSVGYGQWGFLPVTDGDFIQERPTVQLQAKKVNGLSILSGNNAEEGPAFTPQNVTTQEDFINFVKFLFPRFTDNEVNQVLEVYPSTSAPVDPSDPKYATAGDMGATAVNVSVYGTGQQQRANNLYAETTFVCPSYWLAEAYSGDDRTAYKYQFSVVAANHGADVAGYFGPRPQQFSPDFEMAFMKIWGNYITHTNPSIPSEVANGASSNSTAINPASMWPEYSLEHPVQINLNQTGGEPYSTPGAIRGQNVTQFTGPTLRNDIRLVDAASWEGGRLKRCNFWREVGALVPEK